MSKNMVISLLDGSKGETRRTNEVQPFLEDGRWHAFYPWGGGGHGIYPTEEAMRREFDALSVGHYRFQVGQELYVREAYAVAPKFDHLKPSELPEKLGIFWQADFGDHFVASATQGRYRHARFMPGRIARIILKVTEVKSERLKEITKEGAINEGIEPITHIARDADGQEFTQHFWRNYLHTGKKNGDRKKGFGNPILSYASLWNLINNGLPDLMWDANPMVLTTHFDIVEILDH